MIKWRSNKSRDRALASTMRLFADDMTVEDERQLKKDRLSDDEFKQAFQATTSVLARVEELREDPEMQQLIAEAKNKPSEASGKVYRHSWVGWSIAAMAIIAVTVVFNIYINNGIPTKNTDIKRYVTQTGEQKRIELSDGSIVTLNTGSELLADVNENSRIIILRRGEAYFDVVSDPERAFTVELGGQSVTALGTEFNIQKSVDGYTLAVVEGVVAIHWQDELILPDSSRSLTESDGTKIEITNPGQRQVDAGWVVESDLVGNQLVAQKLQDTSHYHQWRTGMLSFSNEPLINVVRELNRYSARKILIEDASIMNMEIYAMLRIDRLGSALNGLEQGNPIKINYYFDRIVIVGTH